MISTSQLKSIMPYASNERVKSFIEPLNRAMERYHIDTPLRAAAFLAQVAHESGSLRYVHELASGAAYEGRKDLGNTNAGDGVKYKGRGLIQLTGRANYSLLSKAFGVDFLSNPLLLEGPEFASLSAGWFWHAKGLNALADKQDFRLITKRINGGYNGEAERNKFYEIAKKVLII